MVRGDHRDDRGEGEEWHEEWRWSEERGKGKKEVEETREYGEKRGGGRGDKRKEEGAG